MAQITITAADGQRLIVRKQRLEMKPSVITEQGFDAQGNPAMTQKFGPKQPTWPEVEATTIASEVRGFDVEPKTERLIVEIAE